MSDLTRYKVGLVATGEDGRGMGFPGLIPDPNGFIVTYEDCLAAERRGAEKGMDWMHRRCTHYASDQDAVTASMVSEGLAALFPEGGR